MIRLLVLALAAGFWACAAARLADAAELPKYDVEAHCTKVAEFGGGSDVIHNGCVEQEQQSYDQLKRNWLQISA